MDTVLVSGEVAEGFADKGVLSGSEGQRVLPGGAVQERRVFQDEGHHLHESAP
jgi:hypothetical protein